MCICMGLLNDYFAKNSNRFVLDKYCFGVSLSRMRTLAAQFKRSGFTFTQVERVGNAAIYEQVSVTGARHYEVIRIRSRDEKQAFGRTFEGGEYYPSSEEWGVAGWTYTDLSRAKRRLWTLLPPEGTLGGGANVNEAKA